MTYIALVLTRSGVDLLAARLQVTGPMATAAAPPTGMRTTTAVVLLVTLFAASVGVQVARDRVAPRSAIDDTVLYVRSPAAMRRIVLGYDAIAADIYWIRAIQHFGGTRRQAGGTRKYELLAPLLDLTTGLDPLFNIAYRFGAVFLSEAPPGGPGRPDLAIRLLERGIEAQPHQWRYMQDLGFVHYWWRRDYTEAAAWFDRAADVPGAPWWLRSMAADTLARGGDRAASRSLWQALGQTADNDWLRRDAVRRLQQLDALDARDALQRGRPAVHRGRRTEALFVGGTRPRQAPQGHSPRPDRRGVLPRSLDRRRRRGRRLDAASLARRPTAGGAALVEAPPFAFGAVFVTLMGLTIGSFLNVVIHRLPRDQSLAFPPSNCPACHAPIRWYHNIPLLGYALIGGRCAACRAPVSIRYPLVEAITGALFLWHYLVIGPEWLLLVRLAFAAAMVALFAIDLEHQILPDEITLGGIVLGFAASLVVPPGWVSSLVGIIAGGLIPWGIAEAYLRVRGVEGLGFGDVKMLAMIGAVLGWPLMLLTLLIASLVGALVGVTLIVSGRGTRQLRLPFGTFLAVAALLAGLHGTPLLEWYAALFS